jgi:hypothetical protein
MSIENPTLVHFRHFSSLYTNLRSTFVERTLQIRPFMQNKPNFRNDVMSVNIFITRIYEENGHSGRQKTNPIQTQLKPKQTQFNPIQSQFKPNCTPQSDRTEIRYRMYETTCLWQLQFKTVFYIIIVLLDIKLLKS